MKLFNFCILGTIFVTLGVFANEKEQGFKKYPVLSFKSEGLNNSVAGKLIKTSDSFYLYQPHSEPVWSYSSGGRFIYGSYKLLSIKESKENAVYVPNRNMEPINNALVKCISVMNNGTSLVAYNIGDMGDGRVELYNSSGEVLKQFKTFDWKSKEEQERYKILSGTDNPTYSIDYCKIRIKDGHSFSIYIGSHGGAVNSYHIKKTITINGEISEKAIENTESAYIDLSDEQRRIEKTYRAYPAVRALNQDQLDYNSSLQIDEFTNLADGSDLAHIVHYVKDGVHYKLNLRDELSKKEAASFVDRHNVFSSNQTLFYDNRDYLLLFISTYTWDASKPNKLFVVKWNINEEKDSDNLIEVVHHAEEKKRSNNKKIEGILLGDKIVMSSEHEESVKLYNLKGELLDSLDLEGGPFHLKKLPNSMNRLLIYRSYYHLEEAQILEVVQD